MSMYSYDRRAALPRLDSVLHKPAEADDALRKAYLALHSFKAGFDSMNEIPQGPLADLYYKHLMKALGDLDEAMKSTDQVRQMTKRLPR